MHYALMITLAFLLINTIQFTRIVNGESCAETLYTPWYIRTGGTSASNLKYNAINQGRITGVSSWSSYTNGGAYAYKGVCNFRFTRVDQTIFNTFGVAGGWGCGGPFQLEADDYINGYRVLAGEWAILGLYFYTKNGHTYGCKHSSIDINSTKIKQDSGIISHSERELIGFGIWAGTAMGAITFQFSPNCTYSPTLEPTANPTTPYPSKSPLPFGQTHSPTLEPTINPTLPSLNPTSLPSLYPTSLPSSIPSNNPTDDPTSNPSIDPTNNPTKTTNDPTTAPTEPTFAPTESTFDPTIVPTFNPTINPSKGPTGSPSASPTSSPTLLPSNSPSSVPSYSPSYSPTTCVYYEEYDENSVIEPDEDNDYVIQQITDLENRMNALPNEIVLKYGAISLAGEQIGCDSSLSAEICFIRCYNGEGNQWYSVHNTQA